MPVTVKFLPNVSSTQAQVIPDATVFNDGVMTKAQAAAVNEIVNVGVNSVVTWSQGETWSDITPKLDALNKKAIVICIADTNYSDVSSFTIDSSYDISNVRFIANGPRPYCWLYINDGVDISNGNGIVNIMVAEPIILQTKGKIAPDGCQLYCDVYQWNTPGGPPALSNIQHGGLQYFSNALSGNTPSFPQFHSDVDFALNMRPGPSATIYRYAFSGTGKVAALIGQASLGDFLQGSNPNNVTFELFTYQLSGGGALIPGIVTAGAAVNATDPTSGNGMLGTDTTKGLCQSDGSHWNLLSRLPTPTAVQTGAYTAKNFDLVRCDPTAGAFAVTLPAATAAQVVFVKNQSASTNAITVTAGAGNTIDGASTLVLNTARAYAMLYSDGVSDWMVL